NEMLFSLNCLVSEQTPNDILNVPIGKSFTREGKVNIKFTDMTVANFKEQLYRTKEVKEANITKMNIYKVELELDSLEDDKTYTKDDINATGQKRHADSESVDIEFVDTKPKRKKDIPTLESLIVDFEEKIPLDRPPELYSISNIAGRFYKRDIPISSKEYVDMRLDVETTDTGRKLINNLKNETKACYFLYAVSGAGKTRAIFDMSMNENGIYVVYVECRPSSDINRNYEPTADRNFAQLVASIGSAFGPYNDTINNSAREEAKRLIILEFTARVLYLILLKKKFPGITPRDYLLSQLNGRQECIASIRNELRLFGCDFDDLISIISSALKHLKDKLPGQKSLIFAIDESNVASNKLFSGYFRNINNNPRGLLTPMIEILRLFEISIVIAGTAFTLKQGSNIQRDIGKGSKAKYIINFNTTDSKGVEAYIMRYLELSDCKIDDIEDSKYLVGRPRLMARLIKEIINAEKVSQENKQMVLEYAVNKTVQSIKNDMMDHLEVIVNKAYEKEDWENAEL
ncbi:5581_t:CDS:2, partial [Rhizophagus irregularis]